MFILTFLLVLKGVTSGAVSLYRSSFVCDATTRDLVVIGRLVLLSCQEIKETFYSKVYKRDVAFVQTEELLIRVSCF